MDWSEAHKLLELGGRARVLEALKVLSSRLADDLERTGQDWWAGQTRQFAVSDDVTVVADRLSFSYAGNGSLTDKTGLDATVLLHILAISHPYVSDHLKDKLSTYAPSLAQEAFRAQTR